MQTTPFITVANVVLRDPGRAKPPLQRLRATIGDHGTKPPRGVGRVCPHVDQGSRYTTASLGRTPRTALFLLTRSSRYYARR
jgi:hypothetical protein